MNDRDPAILVVDDVEDNLYMLTRRLRRLGFENVVTAKNGHEALARLAEAPFDLMLLDIMMPGMDGYEVLARVKENPRLRDIPVIVVSAVGEMESAIRCIELGAEDRLPKPFDPILLRARISASLEKKKLRDMQTEYLRRIETEKSRADAILHDILPDAAVDELMTTNAVQPRRFEEVAVLFCDIVGFTSFCERVEPEAIVSHLESWVDAAESVAVHHGLEKIKTIGDEFMATAGLLHPVERPARAALQCGLGLVATAAELDAHWAVRVGVHVGPVVAGVIGRRKYQFDLWGDTVNTASRVTRQANPGTVLCSATTWEAAGPDRDGLSRGSVDLKGKGQVELFECRGIG